MNTYVVDPWGKGTHLTVQGALGDAAKSDTVRCVPGVYAESVSMPWGVTLMGLNLCAPPGSYHPRYMVITEGYTPFYRRRKRYIAKGGIRK